MHIDPLINLQTLYMTEIYVCEMCVCVCVCLSRGLRITAVSWLWEVAPLYFPLAIPMNPSFAEGHTGRPQQRLSAYQRYATL